ncbi:hypothetical protein ATCC90586_000959 [Pythium insidiosum]|nr:hypothetical protein ATCC90586_000959 [Pythium insidiosum]
MELYPMTTTPVLGGSPQTTKYTSSSGSDVKDNGLPLLTQPSVHVVSAPVPGMDSADEFVEPFDMQERGSQRFVAGEAFFNYAQFGSLRPGLEPAELFSREYVGLTALFALNGFGFYFCAFGFGRVLSEYLRDTDAQDVQAVKYVLVWPQCLTVVMGLLSDSKPLCGLRRKSYILLGLMLCAAMCGLVIIVDMTSAHSEQIVNEDPGIASNATSDSSTGIYASVLLTLTLLAAFGNQLVLLACSAMSVELAQREQLRRRGFIQGTLVAFYNVGRLAALILTAELMEELAEDDLTSKISVAGAAVVLGLSCLVSVPFAVWFLHESASTDSAATHSLKTHTKDFWKFCRGNLAFRIIAFLIGHLFLIGMFSRNARDAVSTWSHISGEDSLYVEVGKLCAMLISTLAWVLWFRNHSWRALAILASLGYVVVYALLYTLTIFDFVRSRWLYGICIALADIPRGWLLLFVLVLSTEVASAGREGAIVGLCISFQTLSGLTCYVIAALIPGVSDAEVSEDTSSTRNKVAMSAYGFLAFNLLCLLTIRLLPVQKLDAQQLRVFGGYNKFASRILGTVFVVLVIFNLVCNLVVLLSR